MIKDSSMELNKLRLIVPTDFDHIEDVKKTEKHSRAQQRGCGAQIVNFIKSSFSVFCGQRRPKNQHRPRKRKRGGVSFHDTDGTGLREKEVTGSENARIFTYTELYIGTNGFSETELLGSGGFGRVYKAVLPSDGTTVAVKCVAEEGERFEKSFAAELLAVAHLRHRNLVRLRGWCSEENRLLLVYDYMPNRSLDRALFRRAEPPMGWRRRRKIVKGLAAALHYLHDNLETQIVHRDVKASNVMLDSGFNARLGDFGLARWLEHDPDSTPMSESEISSGSTTFRLSETSRVGGTIGYLPPEAFRRKASAAAAAATAKSDVFSFGIVALEVASGRRAVELSCPDDEIVLLDWLRNLSDNGNVLRAADPRLVGTAVPRDEIERLIHVALLCTLNSPISRPSMKWAEEALSGSLSGGLPPLPLFKPYPKYITVTSSPPSAATTTATFSSVTSSGYITAAEETLYATAEDGSTTGASAGSSRMGNVRRIFPTVQTPREISYAEIEEATNGFSDSRRVAELDFGSAYRGVLTGGSGPEVLIKRLGMKTCPALRVRFSAELQNLGRLRHRNLVQLRGWCTERGEMLVVYDYSPSRLLAIALPTLSWQARYDVAKSLASAVRYLHEEWEETVVHRNITSSAVVLDPGSDSPRLGSFALAEFLTRNAHGHHVSNDAKPARGIFGYMAPEYLNSGEATAAADVYGFGVVVLEIVTGEAAVDFRRPEALLPARVRGFLARKRAVEGLADARLEGEWDPREMTRLVRLGVACTVSDPESRPTMSEIVRILDGNEVWFVDKARKKESVDKWKQANASSLLLVNRVQALGLQ